MSIFGKHIFRSIKKELIQPIMIILILCLCVAVMILSVMLPWNIYRESKESLRIDEWYDDMTVELKSSSDVRLMFEDEIAEALGDRGEVIGEFILSGFFKPDDEDEDRVLVDFGAFDLEAADQFYEIRYVEYGKFTSNNIDSSVILYEEFAEKYGFKLGDTFSVNILGKQYDFVVQAIAMRTGILQHADVLVDISSIRQELAELSPLIASLSSDFNPYTKMHIKLNEGYDAEAVKAELESMPVFEDKVIEVITDSIKGDYLTTVFIITILMPGFLLIIVAAMMMISSLNLLQKKRRLDMTLFKLVGADSRHLNSMAYLESFFYGLVGGVFGSLLSIPAMAWLNRVYNFSYSLLEFGAFEAALGIGSSVLFTLFCTWSHIRKQKKNSLAEELAGGNLDTDRHISLKKLIPLIPVAVLLIVIMMLPATLRYIPAFFMLVAVVVFVYTIVPYVIGWFAKLVTLIIDKRKNGSGAFMLAAKSCANSYPLRHAGRIMTVLMTITMSVAFVISAVEGEMRAYVDFAKFDYVAYEVDNKTKEYIDQLDGVVATAEIAIGRDIIINGNINTHGVASVGDTYQVFNTDVLPERMPQGDELIISRGVAKMYELEVGDRVECIILDVPCELTVFEILDNHGDYSFYDADYVGSKRRLTCVLTDGTQDAKESLIALFNERGINYRNKDEFYTKVNYDAQAHITVVKYMLVAIALLASVGVFNVLNEQRMERRQEFDVIRQNGASKRGIFAVQATEIAFVFISSFLMSLVFAYVICRIVDFIAVSYGMTLFA